MSSKSGNRQSCHIRSDAGYRRTILKHECELLVSSSVLLFLFLPTTTMPTILFVLTSASKTLTGAQTVSSFTFNSGAHSFSRTWLQGWYIVQSTEIHISNARKLKVST
jgi:hypothetical protein